MSLPPGCPPVLCLQAQNSLFLSLSAFPSLSHLRGVLFFFCRQLNTPRRRGDQVDLRIHACRALDIGHALPYLIYACTRLLRESLLPYLTLPTLSRLLSPLCVHVCMYIYVCASYSLKEVSCSAKVCKRAVILSCAHTHTHTHIHPYINTYIDTPTYTPMYMSGSLSHFCQYSAASTQVRLLSLSSFCQRNCGHTHTFA